MPSSNRYKGILQPRQLGLPRGEVPLILLYDIEEDRIRNRVSEACLDYGLERIQFSAFFGRLTRDNREQLALRLLGEVDRKNVRIRIIPLTEECLESMWEYDWWRKDADQLDCPEGVHRRPHGGEQQRPGPACSGLRPESEANASGNMAAPPHHETPQTEPLRPSIRIIRINPDE